MSTSPADFINEITQAWRRLEYSYNFAEWEAATTGRPEASTRLTQAEVARKRFFADPKRLEIAKTLHESAEPTDALTERSLKLIYLECVRAQSNPALIQQLAETEAQLRNAHTNFRATLDGQTVSDNELEEILANSRSSAEVQTAWEASKEVGPQVAEDVRQAARLRNQMAQAQGYRDHFQKALTIEEIDEAQLLAIFAKLEEVTAAPFIAMKSEIDDQRAEWFGLPDSQLRPWHYGDRFFQTPPRLGMADPDSLYADKDPVELAINTYDALGLDTRKILVRSDLYARPGKIQHAFCTDLDREGDIRTLNNLEPNARWTTTLLHELGHAVYDKNIDPQLPWILRKYPHLLSTEAIALLMGGLTNNEEWLTQVLELSPTQADQWAALARQKERFNKLIFTRWVLVMTNFERALYADPESDLDTLWWDLVEKYQMLHRPEGRQSPDWASKFHIALAPVYYHNYELGYLTAAQIQQRLQAEAGGLVGRKAAGQWLVGHWFQPGNRQIWAQHIATATGEPLNPDYFAQAL